jgi:hypothetical protein
MTNDDPDQVRQRGQVEEQKGLKIGSGTQWSEVEDRLGWPSIAIWSSIK